MCCKFPNLLGTVNPNVNSAGLFSTVFMVEKMYVNVLGVFFQMHLLPILKGGFHCTISLDILQMNSVTKIEMHKYMH